MSNKIYHTKGMFRSIDGTAIHYNCYQPVDGYKASIIVIHGLGEHSGRYADVIDYLVPKGFAVFTSDLRGHGKSEGKRGCIRSFDDYLNDLHRFRCYFSMSFEGKPLFLLGHSLGGTIAFLYSLEHAEGLNGIVLSSPAFGINLQVSGLKKMIAGFLNLTLPNTCFNNGIDPKALSKNTHVVNEYREDPLVHSRASVRLYSEFQAAIQRAKNNAVNITIPSYFMVAENDRIVSTEASRNVFENLTIDDKQMYICENCYHELLRESDNGQMLQKVKEWLLARI